MCFVNRNPVLVLQPGKSLIAGHLIARKHIGMNRHNQIHRTKLLLNKADDLRSCIFYTEYNNSIMHKLIPPVLRNPCLQRASYGGFLTNRQAYSLKSRPNQLDGFSFFYFTDFLYTSQWQGGFPFQNHNPDRSQATLLLC